MTEQELIAKPNRQGRRKTMVQRRGWAVTTLRKGLRCDRASKRYYARMLEKLTQQWSHGHD